MILLTADPQKTLNVQITCIRDIINTTDTQSPRLTSIAVGYNIITEPSIAFSVGLSVGICASFLTLVVIIVVLMTILWNNRYTSKGRLQNRSKTLNIKINPRIPHIKNKILGHNHRLMLTTMRSFI
jgi:hypothetical protein